MIKDSPKQSGFTIIELLLALVFFSFILLFATASYIQINRSYVRGANVKLIQEETRKVVSEISTAIRESGGNIIVNDNDSDTVCNESAAVNLEFGDPLTSAARDCRHRVCVGNKRFAWNEGLIQNPAINSSRDEHSWYYYDNSAGEFLSDLEESDEWLFNILKDQPKYSAENFFIPFNTLGDLRPDPFALLAVESSGSTDDDCLSNIVFQESTDLVDSSRVAIQDIDVFQPFPDDQPSTWQIEVTLSTIDNTGSTQNTDDDTQDLMYGFVNDPSSGADEYKAESCHTDQGSKAFCYVETLSTIVTIR